MDTRCMTQEEQNLVEFVVSQGFDEETAWQICHEEEFNKDIIRLVLEDLKELDGEYHDYIDDFDD